MYNQKLQIIKNNRVDLAFTASHCPPPPPLPSLRRAVSENASLFFVKRVFDLGSRNSVCHRGIGSHFKHLLDVYQLLPRLRAEQILPATSSSTS
jgi:hypothetical protein